MTAAEGPVDALAEARARALEFDSVATLLADADLEDEARPWWARAADAWLAAGDPHAAGASLQRLGREEEARPLFERAAALHAEAGELLLHPPGLACALRDLGRHDEAMAVLILAAQGMEREGRFGEASEVYLDAGRDLDAERVLVLESEVHLAAGRRYEAAMSLEAAGRHREAATLYGRAADELLENGAGSDPGDQATIDQLVHCLQRAGRADEARQALLSRAEVSERQADWDAAARALAGAGEEARAAEMYLRLAAAHEAAGSLDEAATALWMAGREDEAAAMARRSAAADTAAGRFGPALLASRVVGLGDPPLEVWRRRAREYAATVLASLDPPPPDREPREDPRH